MKFACKHLIHKGVKLTASNREIQEFNAGGFSSRLEMLHSALDKACAYVGLPTGNRKEKAQEYNGEMSHVRKGLKVRCA